MDLKQGHSYLIIDAYQGGTPSSKNNEVFEVYVETVRERHYQLRYMDDTYHWVLIEDFHRQFNVEDKLGQGPFTATITTSK